VNYHKNRPLKANKTRRQEKAIVEEEWEGKRGQASEVVTNRWCDREAGGEWREGERSPFMADSALSGANSAESSGR
jgi:hypothetical protein